MFLDQKPSLLLSLDLSTYSWICCWSTGSSTTSLVLNEAYRDGSKSAGLCLRAPLTALHLSTSVNYISNISYSNSFLLLREHNNMSKRWDNIDVD